MKFSKVLTLTLVLGTLMPLSAEASRFKIAGEFFEQAGRSADALWKKGEELVDTALEKGEGLVDTALEKGGKIFDGVRRWLSGDPTDSASTSASGSGSEPVAVSAFLDSAMERQQRQLDELGQGGARRGDQETVADNPGRSSVRQSEGDQEPATVEDPDPSNVVESSARGTGVHSVPEDPFEANIEIVDLGGARRGIFAVGEGGEAKMIELSDSASRALVTLPQNREGLWIYLSGVWNRLQNWTGLSIRLPSERLRGEVSNFSLLQTALVAKMVELARSSGANIQRVAAAIALKVAAFFGGGDIFHANVKKIYSAVISADYQGVQSGIADVYGSALEFMRIRAGGASLQSIRESKDTQELGDDMNEVFGNAFMEAGILRGGLEQDEASRVADDLIGESCFVAS